LGGRSGVVGGIEIERSVKVDGYNPSIG